MRPFGSQTDTSPSYPDIFSRGRVREDIENLAPPVSNNAQSIPHRMDQQQFLELQDKYLDYYMTRYPSQQLWNWLYYGGIVDPTRREISYEGSQGGRDSFVKRFVVMQNADQWNARAREINPLKLKFDVGPCYTKPMDTRVQRSLVPEWREFVFDIDADDFKTVRHCCQDKAMCDKCWRFMECAACVLMHFCQIYGFEQYFFAFSGRRGLHCWICDEYARKLSQNIRMQFLAPFELIRVDTGTMVELAAFNEDQDNKLTINSTRASPTRNILYTICRTFFEIMESEQEWFGAHWEETKKVVEMLNGKPLPQKASENGRVALQHIMEQLPLLYEKICIYYTYPRFDIKVTTSMNHLLKVPFSIHPKARNVSCPINHQKIVEAYKLGHVLQFEYEYQSLQKRFQVSKPVKIDESINEEVRFFEEVCSRMPELRQ